MGLMDEQLSLQQDIESFEQIPVSDIAGSYSHSVSSFWGASMLISIMTASIYIPTTVNKGSSFLTASQNFLPFVFWILAFLAVGR